MKYSKFYKPSPASDEVIRLALACLLQYRESDATDRILRQVALEPVYAEVPDHGNLHSEVGRQIRKALNADILKRVHSNGPHKSFTQLREPH